MDQESIRLKNHVHETVNLYQGLDDYLTSIKLSSEKWSIKEIFGHLVDSAANNYQRFVRLQETDRLVFPGYNYNWIEIIKYNSYPYIQIVELWKQYNLLLCHLFENISDSNLKNIWIIDDQELTLQFLITDYIDHLEIHLKQLKGRLTEIRIISVDRFHKEAK